jgi:putative flippase GtrA
VSTHATQKSFTRWIKFNLVGVVGIGVQLAALWLLTTVGMNYIFATALAVEAAVLHNFLWHERFTWPDRCAEGKRDAAGRLMRFNLTTGVLSIGGNVLLMRLLVGEAHLPALAANTASIGVCSIANFLVSDRWVFRAAAYVEK